MMPTYLHRSNLRTVLVCVSVLASVILAGGPVRGEDRAAEARRDEPSHAELRRRARLAAASLPPTEADVAYGPHERNALDLWLPAGIPPATPRPLVVFIHGGGWIGGDKSEFDVEHFKRFLDAGLAVASINYRYSTIEPFPAPMRDAGRAIQFLRTHAERYGIDPNRIAAYGVSAGATTSLWLACHDDLADPSADDPVLRRSTRLSCAGSIAGPTTLDKATMDNWFGMEVVTHKAMFPFFGVRNAKALYGDRVRKVAAEASPIAWLSNDDPPLFLDYPQDLLPLPTQHTPGEMIHHPQFGVKLKEACDTIGVEAVFQARNRPQDRYRDLVDFLINKLTDKP